MKKKEEKKEEKRRFKINAFVYNTTNKCIVY